MIGDAIVPRDRDGDVSVKPQDRTTEPLDLFFIKQLGNATTLSTPAAQGDYEITVASTTGFVAGTYLGMFTPEGKFHFATQIGAPAGNVLTLDTAVCCPFDSGVSSVLNFTRDMNVDGSDTRQIFQIGPVGPGAGLVVDITKILLSLTDNLAMDDSKFGGNGALTRGVVLRKNNHEFINYSNWKCNSCISLYSGQAAVYSDKAGGGNYGVAFQVSYSGQENRGVTIRLIPGDILELVIQDDLTELVSFRAVAQGHVVEKRAMADPVLIEIPVRVWTKVATGVVPGTVLPVLNGPQYVYTLRDTGNAPPSAGDYTEAKRLPWEGKEISASAPIDVYVSVSAGSDPGKVRVDL
jgi:hypothetical protein